MFSKKTIEIVKSTVPVLEIYGEKITEVFYKNLFQNNPELKDMFNMTNQEKGTQPQALAGAVLKYGAHIDKLEALGPTVETIAQKHASLQVTPEMYPIVGENLLGAIKEVLGDAATDEILDAWGEAYGALASIFVSKEESLYKEREEVKGGFRGMKNFTVAKIVEESSVIKSFYLERTDGEDIPEYKSGQFTAVQIEIPGTSHKHTRNYSLSDFGNEQYLRLSIKRERGEKDGVVSNYIHGNLKEGELLKLSMPSGEFVLSDSDQPVVIIAGGVGVTPLLSMYKDLVLNTKREVVFIHCVLNGSTQAFKEEVLSLKNERVQYVSVFSDPDPSDILHQNYDFKGYLTQEIIVPYVKDTSEIYFCGPTPFMKNTLQILSDIEVPDQSIHFEFFGPEEELTTV